MNVFLAEVASNFDPNGAGTLKAYINGFGVEAPLPVIYTSPFMPGTKGTFKPPTLVEGTPILVCLIDDYFYFMGCRAFSHDIHQTDSDVPFLAENDTAAVAHDRLELEKQGSGRDNSFIIQNDMGYGIELAQTLGPLISAYTKLYTPGEKRIIMNDNPNVDSIALDTGKGSKVVLTGDPLGHQTLPYAGFVVDTELSQRYINRGGKTSIVIDNGTELNIINRSPGIKPTPEVLFPGNVNVQAARGDVNLFSQEGSIFIECTQLVPGGDITIRSGIDGKITLEAGNVHINAASISFSTTNFDVFSAGNINFQSGGNINLLAGGTVNADGTLINLNSGVAGPANIFNTPGLPINKYPIGLPPTTL